MAYRIDPGTYPSEPKEKAEPISVAPTGTPGGPPAALAGSSDGDDTGYRGGPYAGRKKTDRDGDGDGWKGFEPGSPEAIAAAAAYVSPEDIIREAGEGPSAEVIIGAAPKAGEVVVKNIVTGEMYTAPGTPEQIETIKLQVAQAVPGGPPVEGIPTDIGRKAWKTARDAAYKQQKAEKAYVTAQEEFEKEWSGFRSEETGEYQFGTLAYAAYQASLRDFDTKWGKYKDAEGVYQLGTELQVELFNRDKARLDKAFEAYVAAFEGQGTDFEKARAALIKKYGSYEEAFKAAQATSEGLPYTGLVEGQPSVSIAGAVSAGVTALGIRMFVADPDLVGAAKIVSEAKARQYSLGELSPWISAGGINIAGAELSGMGPHLLKVGVSQADIDKAVAQFKAPPVIGAPAPAEDTWWTTPILKGETALRPLPPTYIPPTVPGVPSDVSSRLQELLRGEYEPGMEMRRRLSDITPEDVFVSLGAAALPFVGPLAPLLAPKLVGGLLGVGAATLFVTTPGTVTYGALIEPPELKVSVYEGVDTKKIGTTESLTDIAPYVKPSGEIDYAGMVAEHGEAGAAKLMAQAGQKPVIPLEVFEKLSPNVQALYTPTKRRGLAYEPGIVGAYGRGVEAIWQPPVEWLQKKGIAGQIGAGVFQYMVPHTLVSELYREKGALAALTAIPHFGPTAAYTGLTWERQPWYGKVMGLGFAVLPYAVGPAGIVAKGFGRVVGRVPYAGPVITRAGAVVAEPFRWAGMVAREVKLEQWAPWRAAYQVSGLAGRAGLARVPGIGPFGMRAGWWPGQAVPYAIQPKARPMTEAELKVAESRLFRAAETAGKLEVTTPKGTYYQYSPGKWRLVPRLVPEAPFRPSVAEGVPPYRAYPTAESLRAHVPYGELERLLGPEVAATIRWPRAAQPPAIEISLPGATWVKELARRVPALTLKAAMVAPLIGAPFMPALLPAVAPVATVQASIQAADQLLKEEQITAYQHQQIVQELEQVQLRAEVRQQVVQQQLEKQEITQQQAQIEIQETQQQVAQQIEEVQQQVLTQEQIEQQQLQIERLQQQVVQQPFQMEQMQQQMLPQPQITQPVVPPAEMLRPPVTPPIIPPFLLLPEIGAPRLFGGGRRVRGIKRELVGGRMVWPGLAFYFPKVLSLEKRVIPLVKKRVRKYGARRRLPGPGAGGIRL